MYKKTAIKWLVSKGLEAYTKAICGSDELFRCKTVKRKRRDMEAGRTMEGKHERIGY